MPPKKKKKGRILKRPDPDFRQVHSQVSGALAPSANGFLSGNVTGIPGVSNPNNPLTHTGQHSDSLTWEDGGTAFIKFRRFDEPDQSMLELKRLREIVQSTYFKDKDKDKDKVLIEFDTGNPERDLQLAADLTDTTLVREKILVTRAVSGKDDDDSDDSFSASESESESESGADMSPINPSNPPFRFSRSPEYLDFLSRHVQDHSSPNRPQLFNAEPVRQFLQTFKPKKGVQRNRHDGRPVDVHLETISRSDGLKMTRPTRVEGYIEPTVTTGRDSAPEPIAGVRVSQSRTRNAAFSDRNRGMPDVQKGHIMALELGGPDVPENIVPQWAQWQSNGRWRQMERQVLVLGKSYKAQGKDVKFVADIHYRTDLDQQTASYLHLGFPIGFTVHLQVFDQNGIPEPGFFLAFNEEQSQNHTDDKLAGRVFDSLEGSSSANPLTKKQKKESK